MRKIQTAIVLLFLLSFAQSLQAQRLENLHHQLLWLQYYNQAKISEKWVWLSDAGYRRNLSLKRSVYIVRTGIGYLVHPDVRLALGFVIQGATFPDPMNVNEYRPYQGIQWTQTLNSLKLEHQLRIEERLRKFENQSDTYNTRFRYRFFITWPFLKFSSHPNMSLALNAGDEIFLNVKNQEIRNTFDQNRLLLGFSLKIDSNLSISCVYNFQYSEPKTLNIHRNEHVIWLYVRHNINLMSPVE